MATRPRSDSFVFFGATGDLAKKKIFPALYNLQKRGRLGVPVIGVASRMWGDDQLRAHARESILTNVKNPDLQVVEDLLAGLTYQSGNYQDPYTFLTLAEKLKGRTRPLFYLAIPPSMFEQVAVGLKNAGLAENGRVVVEKPFGRDLQSCASSARRCTGALPKRASSISTTSSARSRSRTSSCSASRTR